MAQATIKSGTPFELAESIRRLPEGEYRVLVQRVGSRSEALAALDGVARDIRDNPDPDLAGKSEEEVMDVVNAAIEEERAKRGGGRTA